MLNAEPWTNYVKGICISMSRDKVGKTDGDGKAGSAVQEAHLNTFFLPVAK